MCNCPCELKLFSRVSRKTKLYRERSKNDAGKITVTCGKVPTPEMLVIIQLIEPRSRSS